ncbi:STAS domain-containing protein [Streptomyces sp. NPDC102409]|uniref:STAS domain-containing protein n=1 Tax=Streptomyces sp. NPDC102409 TaxID=3366172 RepID=UPI0037FB08D7
MTLSDRFRSRPAPPPVLAPQGEFDLNTLAPLEAEIEVAITQRCGVVLDASNITFADSTFLRLVLATHHRTDLRIAAPSPAVSRLFHIVGANTVLRLFPTLEDALAH